MQVVVAIPVKPFDAAKSRLSSVLSPRLRRIVSIELARRTVEAANRAGTTPLVLAADAEVSEWAASIGVPKVLDEGSDLNSAARSTESMQKWIVCHADLPLLTDADLETAATLVSGGRTVIAASTDGGTTLLGGGGADFKFAYGPGSFHRHIRRLEAPTVLSTVGLCLDLDGPADLKAACMHPRGQWLARLLASGHQ